VTMKGRRAHPMSHHERLSEGVRREVAANKGVLTVERSMSNGRVEHQPGRVEPRNTKREHWVACKPPPTTRRILTVYVYKDTAYAAVSAARRRLKHVWGCIDPQPVRGVREGLDAAITTDAHAAEARRDERDGRVRMGSRGLRPRRATTAMRTTTTWTDGNLGCEGDGGSQVNQASNTASAPLSAAAPSTNGDRGATATILIAVAASFGGIAILWAIFPKWKLASSKTFDQLDQRLQPIPPPP
jgi:hypothetical protein